MTFTAGTPFSGNHFYNPYAGLDSSKWIKCNFHAHTNSWNHITNGHGNASDVSKAYNALGYAVHSVSDYQKINFSFSNQQNFIPAYEHGYNINKTHQLVIGANKVEWLDYLYPQTIYNKQWILCKLSQQADQVVVLNHPTIRNGFTMEDMPLLSCYHCMEVLNPAGLSFNLWDEALSSGNPIFITGNDDVHNIFEKRSIGNYCTWLNADTVKEKQLLSSLKEGKGYGMITGEIPGEDLVHRNNRLTRELPYLKHLTVNSDTIHVALSKPAEEIQFIGQNGKVLSTTKKADGASYIINSNDSYIRTAIRFENGTCIFLNPVFRFGTSPLVSKSAFMINQNATYLFHVIGILLLSGWLVLLILILFGRIVRPKIRLTSLNPQEPLWKI